MKFTRFFRLAAMTLLAVLIAGAGAGCLVVHHHGGGGHQHGSQCDHGDGY